MIVVKHEPFGAEEEKNTVNFHIFIRINKL